MQLYENTILFNNFDYRLELYCKQQNLMIGGETLMDYNANYELRRFVKEDGLYLWQIASCLGISDSDLSRKLRDEFTLEEKNKVLEIIKYLKNRKENKSIEEGRDTDEHCGPR